MNFLKMAELYERLDSTTKKLQKTEILADFYKECPEKDLYRAVVLSMGIVSEDELGVAEGMIKKAIERAAGATDKEVIEKFKTTGDLGLAAEKLLEKRKQRPLIKKTLTIDMVFDNLRSLTEAAGSGSQDRKVSIIAELLSMAEPKEARYIVRTTLGQMRIGVAAGIVRNAIAKAFEKDPKDLENIYNLLGDYGRVAEQAKKGVLEAEIELFRPIRVMLADRGGEDIKGAVEGFKKTAVETKLDGFRVQIHRNEKNIQVFSRRMENVTKQFPDIVAYAKESIRGDCIVDGEAVAFDYEKRRLLPFQHLSRRIQRKYDIEKMVREIPVQVNLFDIIYLNGESLMETPLNERWIELKKTIKETKNLRLVEHMETSDVREAEKFYKKAVNAGQEGVIVKNMDAKYQPGKRVGYWLKIKPILEPLDLVVIGAEWGEGKRSNWLSSFILGARKGNKLVASGKMASGFTEEQLEELTKKLKPLITKDEGKVVAIKPTVVVEIGYEEIQASPKYESGFAFRFPRLLRIRDPKEKGPYDVDTVQTIQKLYKMQRGRKK